MLATFLGWALDGMDVMLYSFAVPALVVLWHITSIQAGLLATATLVVSSAGGWIAGLAADRYGRVKVLQFTILWFAVFTFLSGLTNSFPQLLVVRALQGLGFGGEWAVGSVLVGEAMRAGLRGRAVGTVQAGWAIGWAVAAGFYWLFFSLLPLEIAWRALFLIGILPAFLVLYIRSRVPEPDVFKRKTADTHVTAAPALTRIFAPDVLRTTLLASSLSIGAQGGYYAMTTWLPLYLKTVRGLSVPNTAGYLLVVIAGSFTGYLVSADLTDRIGRRKTLLCFALLSLLFVWAYTALGVTNLLMLVLGFPLGFFSSGAFSPMGSFLTELFETSMRGSGQGFTYNMGRGIGAVFPALVGYMSAHMPLAQAIAMFAMAAYALMAASVLLLPETRGKILE